jgi:hypothetical protein
LASFTDTLALDGSSFSYTFPAYSMTVLDLSPAALSGQAHLSGSFNSAGIVSDGSTFSSGFDGDGPALSANLPGLAVTWNGNTYALGAADSPDVVQASGQTIAPPAGRFSAPSFLAAAVNGNQPEKTFTVTYTDGTTQTFAQSPSDWVFAQGDSGESIVVTMPYRGRGDGTGDDSIYLISAEPLAPAGSPKGKSP